MTTRMLLLSTIPAFLVSVIITLLYGVWERRKQLRERAAQPEPVVNNGMPEPIAKNAVRCGICGAPADRYANHFGCQANPAHMGDLNVGIFSDCSYPPSDHPSNLEPLPNNRIDRAYLDACQKYGVAVLYNDEPRVPALIYHMDRVGEVVQWVPTSEQEFLAPAMQHITTIDVVLRCARRVYSF